MESETTAAFGLVAWLEQTKITLPLKGVECRFDVTAGVASVEIDQIFHQSHAQPLDCTYTFPLPSGAAVYRCEMHVNGRVIRAKVEAKEDARRIFVEQTAAGHRAALVEAERDNLFTLSLGNLQPQDVVVIRFAYFQTLERIAAQQRLRIPVCPGVRYIPGKPLLRSLSGRGTVDDTDQVPDASRLTPPRIDALHPDAAYFAAEGAIASADVAGGTLSSPTHRLLVHAATEVYDVALATGGAVPDRDLVVAWEEPQEAKLAPRAWTFWDGGETFALVQLRAPAQVGVSDSFEQDVYFLVDRSGSMEGSKWTKTCAALTGFVKVLGARDRVWITLFESSFLDFAEAPLPAPRVLKDRAFVRLVERGVAGGTEVLPAAQHVLAKIAEHSPERPATVIFVTDGQVGNEAEILACFARHPAVTVHVFGIDTAVNDAFLQRLARQHGGDCWLQTPNDDIAATVAGLGDRLRRPVLTQLTANHGWELATSRLPNLYAGQVIDLAFRRGTPAPLEISGVLGSGERYQFPLTPVPTHNAALKLLWARQRIETLIASGASAPALALAKQHNLLCEGAAFVVWDEAENVMIARREIIQPAFAPAVLAQEHVACFRVASPRSERRASSGSGVSLDHLRRMCEMPTRSTRPNDPPAKAADPDLGAELLRAGLDEPLASALAAWADAKWLKRRARRLALTKLILWLGTPAFDRAMKAQLCRAFISRELIREPAVRTSLLAVVDAWERRVHV
ncbi:MAG: VIT domain-containing protein [Chthoniobacteraceae bacterium]